MKSADFCDGSGVYSTAQNSKIKPNCRPESHKEFLVIVISETLKHRIYKLNTLGIMFPGLF